MDEPRSYEDAREPEWVVARVVCCNQKKDADPSRVGELFCWGDDPEVALRLI